MCTGVESDNFLINIYTLADKVELDDFEVVWSKIADHIFLEYLKSVINGFCCCWLEI